MGLDNLQPLPTPEGYEAVPLRVASSFTIQRVFKEVYDRPFAQGKPGPTTETSGYSASLARCRAHFVKFPLWKVISI